jgi:hypothetical protein
MSDYFTIVYWSDSRTPNTRHERVFADIALAEDYVEELKEVPQVFDILIYELGEDAE